MTGLRLYSTWNWSVFGVSLILYAMFAAIGRGELALYVFPAQLMFVFGLTIGSVCGLRSARDIREGRSS